MPCFSACSWKDKTIFSEEKLQYIIGQFENTLNEAKDPHKTPRTNDQNGKLETVGIYSWTSGFFAGNLWNIYQLTNDEKWNKEAAI